MCIFLLLLITNVLIPVRSLPVDSLLRDGLNEEGVGGEGVEVDRGGLMSSAAVCDRLSRSLHIPEEGNSAAGRPSVAPSPGQQALEGIYRVIKGPKNTKINKISFKSTDWNDIRVLEWCEMLKFLREMLLKNDKHAQA